MRRSLALSRVATLAIGAALVLSACGGSSSSSQTLRIGDVGGVDSLNPFNMVSLDSYTAQQYLYPFLVQFDPANHIAPYFARSWAFSPDNKVLTLHTAGPEKWSDGQPLTARDAAWTINAIVKYQTGATALLGGQVAGISSASAPTPTTVVIHYKQPVAAALSNLQQIPILPEHVWAKYATGNGAALKQHQATPGGGVYGGPFVVTKWQKDAVTLFARNPHWWGAKPKLDHWGIQVFGTPDAMMTALRQGQIDVAENVPATVAGTARKSPNVVVSKSPPGGLIFALWANGNPRKTTHRELRDPAVRQALSLAVNRQQIANVAFLGFAQPAGSVIPPPLPGAIQLPSPPFDPARANQLLDSAGFKRGPGGVRIAFGKPMSYQMIVIQGSGNEDRIFSILQSDLAAIGVRVTELTQSGAAAVSSLLAPNNKVTSYNLALATNAPIVDPDFELSQFLCAMIGTQNLSGYCNPKVDSLFAQQDKVVNQSQRFQLVGEIQRIVYRDNAWIPLVYQDVVTAWDRKWTGFVQSIAGPINAYSIESLTSVHRA